MRRNTWRNGWFVCSDLRLLKTPLTLALAECSRLQKWLAIELLPLRATLHNIGSNGQRLILVLLVRPNRGVPCNPHR